MKKLLRKFIFWITDLREHDEMYFDDNFSHARFKGYIISKESYNQRQKYMQEDYDRIEIKDLIQNEIIEGLKKELEFGGLLHKK